MNRHEIDALVQK